MLEEDRHEAEWQRQEAAWAAHRRGQPGGDPAYRLISEALAQEAQVDLPAHFARDVAALAQLQRQPRASFELALAATAMALLGLGAWVAVALNPGLLGQLQDHWLNLQTHPLAAWLPGLAVTLLLTAALPGPHPASGATRT